MIKGLLNWFKQKTSFIFSPKIEKNAAATPATNKNNNKTYLIDANFPSMVLDNPIPLKTLLPMRAKIGRAHV